jgi:hypothetical protein
LGGGRSHRVRRIQIVGPIVDDVIVDVQPSDYSNLLIKPSDIIVPGDTFTLASPWPHHS